MHDLWQRKIELLTISTTNLKTESDTLGIENTLEARYKTSTSNAHLSR